MTEPRNVVPWRRTLGHTLILTGMGPVSPMVTTAGEIFASLYALFSGLLLLTLSGVVLGPVLAHGIHRYHLDLDALDGD